MMGGIELLTFSVLGKFIILFTAICLLVSGAGMIQLKEWGRKSAIYLCGLEVLFLAYLGVGFVHDIVTGSPTSATFTIAIAIYFAPFLFFLLFLRAQSTKNIFIDKNVN